MVWTDFFIGVGVGSFAGIVLGVLCMALVVSGKCADMQAQIDHEKLNRIGDAKALNKTINTLRRSNRALRTLRGRYGKV